MSGLGKAEPAAHQYPVNSPRPEVVIGPIALPNNFILAWGPIQIGESGSQNFLPPIYAFKFIK